MTSPWHAADRARAHQWDVGLSASATEVVLGQGQVRVVALFGTCDQGRSTAPAARLAVEEVWLQCLDDVLYGTPEAVVRGAAEAADDTLRRQFSPSDLDGRGTVAVAVLDHGEVAAGGTALAVALLVREGRIVMDWRARDGDRDHPSGHIHRFAGGRPSDAAPLEPASFDGAWELRSGDRMVLATRDLRAWIEAEELVAMVGSGDPESAAQTLAAVARVRGGGLEVGVSVIDWSADEQEDTPSESAWGDLLGPLEGLVEQLADSMIPEAAPDPSLEDEAPTAGFAPVREQLSHQGEAVLSMSPTEAPSEQELAEAARALEDDEESEVDEASSAEEELWDPSYDGDPGFLAELHDRRTPDSFPDRRSPLDQAPRPPSNPPAALADPVEAPPARSPDTAWRLQLVAVAVLTVVALGLAVAVAL